MALWQALPGTCGDGMRLSLAPGSGGVPPEGDDDVVAEGLELAGASRALRLRSSPGVPARAEVAVAGGGVVQQVPDDDEDGPAHGAAGLFPPAAAGTGRETAEPLAEEGVGVCGGVGGQDGGAWRRCCRAPLPAALRGPDCRAVGVSPAQDARAPGSGSGSCPGRSCDTRSHILRELAEGGPVMMPGV